MKTVNILWTGGWDSTFRVMQLATKNVIIQPYYLKDNRKSENLELARIKSLTTEINQLSTTKSIIQNVITLNVSDLEEDTKIQSSYLNINQRFQDKFNKSLGIQYEWLAKFAKTIEGLELCDEKDTKPLVS